MKSVLKSALILAAALGVLSCREEVEVTAPAGQDVSQPRELVLIRDEPYMEKPYVKIIDVTGWEEGEDAVIIYGEHTIIPYPWQGEDTIMYSYTNDHLLVRGDPQDTTIYFYCGYYGDYRLQKNNLADTINLQGMPYFQGKLVGLDTDIYGELGVTNPEEIVCIGDYYLVNIDSLKQYPNVAAVGISYSNINLPRRPLPLRNLRKISENIDLYVFYVYMRSPDPRKLARLKNLKGLDAYVYPLAGRTLERIGKMRNLRQLKLRFFTVNDDELKHLANLKNLHTLTLDGIKITDRGLRHLAKIRSLRSLRLEEFQPHTREDFRFWFENLTIFTCSSGQYSDRFDYVGFIEEFPYQYGSLFIPHTTAEGWRHLAQLPYLRELDFYHYDVKLTTEDLEGIGSITNLRRLDVGAVGVTDEGLKHLENLTELRDLDLSNNEITDAGVEHLKKLTTLRRLNISYTEVTAEGMASLQRALPECEIICAKRSD
ncbi:hypothetical protein CEE36_07760 [candidate division TA06 bacterium B3_TA06]|uniref:Leucine Rich repeats (2 copies) n=1 Tax=candidate division TA06 bacterium B3_TA06 TaxID=2012487 RepID=A0A532V488_UNCT6|nr:MAG: hypothetical protein CEE36_07760 [candidate division TA06 bacterium B3_TA06]